MCISSMDLQYKAGLNFSKNYFLVKRKHLFLQKQSHSILAGLSFKLQIEFLGEKRLLNEPSCCEIF